MSGNSSDLVQRMLSDKPASFYDIIALKSAEEGVKKMDIRSNIDL